MVARASTLSYIVWISWGISRKKLVATAVATAAATAKAAKGAAAEATANGATSKQNVLHYFLFGSNVFAGAFLFERLW